MIVEVSGLPETKRRVSFARAVAAVVDMVGFQQKIVEFLMMDEVENNPFNGSFEMTSYRDMMERLLDILNVIERHTVDCDQFRERLIDLYGTVNNKSLFHYLLKADEAMRLEGRPVIKSVRLMVMLPEVINEFKG